MTGAKKNITALALLLLVASPLLVSVGYLLQKRYVQHQMKEQLEKASLQTLLLQPHELKWAKAGKELWINNELFDVKDIQLTNKGYCIKGLFDTQETAINKKISQQSKADTKADGTLATLGWLLVGQYPPCENSLQVPMPLVQLGQQYPSFQVALNSVSLGVTTPPPNIA